MRLPHLESDPVLQEVLETKEWLDGVWGSQDRGNGAAGWMHYAELIDARARCLMGAKPTFASMLMEQVALVLRSRDEERMFSAAEDLLRNGLLKVAAHAMRWIERIDARREAMTSPDPVPDVETCLKETA